MTEGLTGIVVAAALLSAALHAAWNAGVKASADPPGAMTAQIVASGMIALPLLTLVQLPSTAALPWLCGSAVCNFATTLALLRGYASGGGFGLVYPLARATSPLLVLLIAHVAAGETVGTIGTLGVACISCGIALFAFGDGRGRPAAVAWALLAGAFAAAYAFCDASGARHSPSVLGYGLTMSALNAVIFSTFHRLRSGVAVGRALRRHLAMATLGSSAAVLSYVLILWVWSHAPIALGAALRDTSVVFAALIATLLGERLSLQRLGAAAVAAAGACLIRFA